MLQVLQQEIRLGSQAADAAHHKGPDLVLGKRIGQGAFGRVHKGWWNKVTAAIKVIPTNDPDHESMKDAVEMAALSSVQHPNVVQLYSCLTDMVEVAPDAGGSGSADSSYRNGSSVSARYRHLSPDEEPDEDAATCNILVMEYCDRGTLRDAVKGGSFHSMLPNGAIGVDVAAVVEVLLDVACAAQYLHSMRLVHGDIKVRAVD